MLLTLIYFISLVIVVVSLTRRHKIDRDAAYEVHDRKFDDMVDKWMNDQTEVSVAGHSVILFNHELERWKSMTKTQQINAARRQKSMIKKGICKIEEIDGKRKLIRVLQDA